MSGAARRRRAVVLVAQPAAPYSRGLRVARSLAAEGWDVEIAATTGPDLPNEERDGDVAIRRYRPSGMLARWAASLTGDGPLPMRRGPLRVLDILAKLVLWPLPPRPWWRTLRRELEPADLYHACGIHAVPVALGLAEDARRRGWRGRVVYDVIDAILDSNNYAGLPAPILAWYRLREARWVRRADAVVTVNDAIADHCARLWPFRERPTVLLNCQPRWDPPPVRPDLIRAAAGLPPERRIVLYLGRLGRERGLEIVADAVLRLPDAALVMLGFGAWADRMRERDSDPRYAGRHVTLPPVHPDDVRAWAASADVSVLAVPANSLNQRLSSPNKFWESLTAGTPVVIGRDLEVMRAIVEADDLGAVADPADPDDVTAALRSILERPPAEYEALRERCLAVSRDRYNWEVAVRPYLALVDGLA